MTTDSFVRCFLQLNIADVDRNRLFLGSEMVVLKHADEKMLQQRAVICSQRHQAAALC
jgi:hypothetical protein